MPSKVFFGTARQARLEAKETLPAKLDLILRANVNNVFDNEYISESETNILYNPDTETTEIGENGSTRNVVFYGFGRTWNAGLKIKF